MDRLGERCGCEGAEEASRGAMGQEAQCVDGEVVRGETIMKACECSTETRDFCLVFFFAFFFLSVMLHSPPCWHRFSRSCRGEAELTPTSFVCKNPLSEFGMGALFFYL